MACGPRASLTMWIYDNGRGLFLRFGLLLLSVNTTFPSQVVLEWTWLVRYFLCLVLPFFQSKSGFFGERSSRASDGIDTR